MSSNKKRRGRIGEWFHRIVPRAYGRAKTKEHGDLIPLIQPNLECPVCALPAEDTLKFTTCGHFACSSCWRTFICNQIDNFAMAHITCIACAEHLPTPVTLHLLTNAVNRPENKSVSGSEKLRCERMLIRYEEFLLRQALAKEADVRWCPRGCGYGLIAQSFQACPQIVCANPKCGRSFCYKCKKPWSTESGSSDAASLTHKCNSTETESRNDALDGIRAFFGLSRFGRQASVAGSADNYQRQISDTSMTSPNGTLLADKPKRSSFVGSQRRSVTVARFLRNDSMDDSQMNVDIEAFYPGEVTQSATTETPASAIASDPETSRRTSTTSTAPGSAVKPCPKCKTLIQKLNDGSCNSMVCPVCGYAFCWLCLRHSSATHYLSLSGCTVWGQRRSSRARRTYAVLGVMLGTPILLPLIIIIGVPTITIVTAISLGNLVNRFNFSNKHIRRLAVIATVTGSLIATPILTTLGIALVLPIILGYIYIYPPIVLIRSCFTHYSASQPEPVDLTKLQPVDPSTYVDESDSKPPSRPQTPLPDQP